MPDLEVTRLVATPAYEFGDEVKARLRDDEAWLNFLHPLLLERTRAVLIKMIDSLDAQKKRAQSDEETDKEWLKRIATLRRFIRHRLDAMPPPSDALALKWELQQWKEFAEGLAIELENRDSEALSDFAVPQSTLTVSQWLDTLDNDSREEEPA